MNKKFLFYFIIWLIFLGLINVICFVTPEEINGYYKYTGAFWTGYIFVTIAMVGHIVCAFFAFRAKNSAKLFLNLPIITVSLTGLFFSFAAGLLCFLVPNFPKWLGIIICMSVLAFTAIAVLLATAASEAVEAIEADKKNKISFLTLMRGEAEALIARAKTEEERKECQKVFDALKYSDPVSDPKLTQVERQIAYNFNSFSECILGGKEGYEEFSKTLISLINERNKRCKWEK